MASLFSRQQTANTQNSNALSANLYKNNTAPAQQTAQPAVPTPSTQIAANEPSVPVPTLVADEATTAAETNANPRWKFWKRKANNAQ